MCLDVYKNIGLDNQPSRFLKDGAEILARPIALIINKSIETGIVPDELKVAKVTSLYKQKPDFEVDNYRSINVLPCVKKYWKNTTSKISC